MDLPAASSGKHERPTGLASVCVLGVAAHGSCSLAHSPAAEMVQKCLRRRDGCSKYGLIWDRGRRVACATAAEEFAGHANLEGPRKKARDVRALCCATGRVSCDLSRPMSAHCRVEIGMGEKKKKKKKQQQQQQLFAD